MITNMRSCVAYGQAGSVSAVCSGRGSGETYTHWE